ncbi:hypothetical protein HHL23_21590 [Chryseobacterium sp. RP-3-3]|uniref:C1q domain-containing protein n=1 Tax=Chryseobacterium antibioticum TaxID=2728847 RepID=A0A7Y0FTG4_9FLAO|nr:hypothetical protein [Chryseobacterium antibioticum]NML72357.1 hypothetical protein [Chryseobacterium antibioticum]
MNTRLLSAFLGLMMIMSNAQVVIGSSNVSLAAILKLDANNKALRIPNLSITSRTSTTIPIVSPVSGLTIYNTNTDIVNNIAKGITYWGSDNQYHSQATPTATEAAISSSQIPLLIFSAAIGQKPITPLGSAFGGSRVALTLTTPEIIMDKYSGWNVSTSEYKIPATGIYMIEFVANMSNTGNVGGTTILELYKAGITTLIATSYGGFNPLTNRMYTTLTTTQNLTVNELLNFKYWFTANNYRMESGTLNIYKYQ